MGRNSRRFLVTPSGYDDIGAVLSQMGEGFEHQVIDWTDLSNARALQGCEVLFLNCSSESADAHTAQRIAPVVRKFVEQGGSIYASDWAGAVVESGFPGLLTFDQLGDEDEFSCTVRDPGLRDMIGGQIDIHFDLGGWWRVLGAKKSVRVYVDAPSSAFAGDWDNEDLDDEDYNSRRRPTDYSGDKAQPIVLAFSHGRGHVIYTSFHNEAQVSEEEQRLLRFLVLRPILAQTAATAATAVQAQQCVPGREILATVNRGGSSSPYLYQAKGGVGLIYVLSWIGAARLRLAVRDPSGRWVHRADGGQPPLVYEAPAAAAGEWACVVEGTAVPHDNFPFVLTLATRGGATSTPPQTVPGIVSPAPAKAVRADLWPCYLLIDCSRSASDMAPRIGRGISALLSILRGTPASGLAPAISFLECRSEGTVMHPLRRMEDLRPLNLTCQGEPALGPALNLLSKEFGAQSALTRGKAFVVIALTAEPGDTFEQAAGAIRELADQNKINLMAVGLGTGVNDQTLTRLARIPLRVTDPFGEETEKCFRWLGQASAAMMQSIGETGGGKAIQLPPLPSGVGLVRSC